MSPDRAFAQLLMSCLIPPLLMSSASKLRVGSTPTGGTFGAWVWVSWMPLGDFSEAVVEKEEKKLRSYDDKVHFTTK